MAMVNSSDLKPQFSLTELNIVTWNINRKKDLEDTVDYLRRKFQAHLNLELHIIFLQETRIGRRDEIDVEGWKAFYTKYSSRKKGAAILIKDDLEFEDRNVVIDKNGCYVILHCKLQQQEFTLASVYNHHDNKKTVALLSEDLKSKSAGMLVIGGDFNTTFSNDDRAKSKPGERLQHYDKPNHSHEKIRKEVDILIKIFKLIDVFNEINGESFTESRFTYIRKHRKELLRSRLDYFFISEERNFGVSKCEVIPDESERDHKPLLLQLRATGLSEQEITEEEIRNAIEVLQLDKLRTSADIRLGMFTKQMVLYLKSRYNDILKDIIEKKENASPQDLFTHREDGDGCIFSVEYLILAKIVSLCLESKCKSFFTESRSAQVNFSESESESEIESEWADFETCLEMKLEEDPLLRDTVLYILKHSVPGGDPGDWKPPRDCPLTEAVCKLIKTYKEDKPPVEE